MLLTYLSLLIFSSPLFPLFLYNMACSKLFSGELPELLNEIMKYLQNDFNNLYSSILVNRLWCCLIIPLLWENPFSTTGTYYYKYHFIEFYLPNHFNDEDKKMLNAFG